MRIGVFVGASAADLMTLDELVNRIRQAEADGFDSSRTKGRDKGLSS